MVPSSIISMISFIVVYGFMLNASFEQNFVYVGFIPLKKKMLPREYFSTLSPIFKIGVFEMTL